MKYSSLPYISLLILTLFFLSPVVIGQISSPTSIKGRITDAVTHEPIPFASVVIDNKTGTTSDLDGNYRLITKTGLNKLQVSSIGYERAEFTFKKGIVQILNIQLKPQTALLDVVVIKPKKERYRNKENPAVVLIDKVIENKPRNRKEGFDYYEYEKYEKTQFALSNFSENLKNRKSLRKFKFIFDNVDSTKLPGTKILPVYLKETISDYYYRKSPMSTKEIVKADKMVTFDGYLDNQGMTEYMKYLYQDINIYDNNITFVSNLFLSPIANTAPSFYKYFIQDTTLIDGSNCVKLYFGPRNKTDLLFQGFMYVTLDSDSVYAIKRIEMAVNKEINLNWVKDVNIIQEFSQFKDEGWLLTTDEISIDFGISKNSSGIFGQRSVSYKDYRVNEPRQDSIFKGQLIDENKGSDALSNAYWKEHRPQQLSRSEQGIYTMTDSIQKIPAFKRTMNIMMLVLSGYRDFGYFEIGPVNTFYSYNPIEGTRARLGGRTTPKFSKKINFETYLAYGFTDKQYKYYLGTTYSLTDNTIYQFPVKSVKLSFQDETKIPGQELQFVQEDNILLSIKRGDNNKLLYNKTFKIEQLNEFSNHFSYTLGYNFIRQSPAGTLKFNDSDYLSPYNNLPYINISEVSLNFRYAPHEQFYQGKQYRSPIVTKYPIFQLLLTLGLKDIGNDYNYQSLKLIVSKRFYPSILGYTDVVWEAGKIFGKVPYPLLTIHRANQTYSYQIASYNLMNFLEFVSDQYTSLNVDHCFNGFIFNKIPVLKRLKLREVITAKVLYGSLNKKNNPDYQSDLFKFPTDESGQPTTFTLEKKPYVEVSAGVSNIFRFFRVDVIKRLTYLDHPGVSDIGIRVRFKFDF